MEGTPCWLSTTKLHCPSQVPLSRDCSQLAERSPKDHQHIYENPEKQGRCSRENTCMEVWREEKLESIETLET